MRWQFPNVEGIVTNVETGEWSNTVFANDMLEGEPPMPVVWHQAPPGPDNESPADWQRWLVALEKPGMAEHLLLVARSGAKHALWRLERGRSPQTN